MDTLNLNKFEKNQLKKTVYKFLVEDVYASLISCQDF